MVKKYLSELKDLKQIIKSLDFKVTYVFLSVAVIIFLSISFATPLFYYNNIGQDRLDSRLYWFFTDGLLMFLIPFLSIKFVLKGKLSDYGFSLGDKKFGLFSVAAFFLFMLPFLWVVSATPDFAKTYPQGGSEVSSNLSIFLLYEAGVLTYMLGWEFLWRGYMLFGLKEKFGYYSIFIQMIPFFILHKGKPELELLGSIFAGLVMGIQAWRSNSFVYSWILHWLIMFSIDTISILREKTGFYKIF
ncbi:MAG: CPBP family intramembrane metalloprotease [Ignavibacteriae bacterium]|nr:CPBP family intramembrane metalloprotease [Ignavibacteriota bacterium]MCB9242798.1 CPBP family intramembrane metalloprotease [Ignavibacteriales bacterium]